MKNKLVVNPNTGEVFYVDGDMMLSIDGAIWSATLCEDWEAAPWEAPKSFKEWQQMPRFYCPGCYVRGVYYPRFYPRRNVWGELGKLRGYIEDGESLRIIALFVERSKAEDPTWWGRVTDQKYRF